MVKVIKTFSPQSLTNRPTKLERLSLGSYFIFVRKAASLSPWRTFQELYSRVGSERYPETLEY
jgi:hypothetical protein